MALAAVGVEQFRVTICGDDPLKQSTMSDGRVCVYVPDHPKANNRGYVLRSRYVVEQHLGRFLLESEEVHHKNEDKTDDDYDNLKVMMAGGHARLHLLKRLAAGKPLRGTKLDEVVLSQLMTQGLGYKRIASACGYPVSSVKSAVRRLRGRIGIDG